MPTPKETKLTQFNFSWAFSVGLYEIFGIFYLKQQVVKVIHDEHSHVLESKVNRTITHLRRFMIDYCIARLKLAI